MATIAFLEKRIDGAKKNITKLEKKLARIEAAQVTGWEKNPYMYSESDLRNTKLDLGEAEARLAVYERELAVETKKANSRNVAPILEFLDRWKKTCAEFYHERLAEAFAERNAIWRLQAEADAAGYGTDTYYELLELVQARRQAYNEALNGKYEKVSAERWGRTITTTKKVKDGKWEAIKPYMEKDLETSMAKLRKDLDREADQKYDFIIERTCAIVGEITDASGLTVGSKGDLNGYIIGTDGKVKVQTIGAGGYNIQCFHFRTLINKA